MRPTTRPPQQDPTRTKLAELVADKVGGQLVSYHMTEEDGGTLEQVFVVLWRRDSEFGTHRAVINYELGESMLVWGHYNMDIHKGCVDYLARIGHGS